MPIPKPYDDVKTPGTPAWWIKRLITRMAARASDIKLYDDYYEGEHRLAFATDKFRKTFGNVFSAFADNWCDLVVDAVEERLNVEGFRVPAEPGTPIGPGDQDAWRIWQTNFMDGESQIAHTEALINGEAYALVWPGDPGTALDGKARITIEHPLQMVCESAEGYRRDTRAAFKAWRDDTGFIFATLYLPDAIFKFQSETKPQSGGLSTETRWKPRIVGTEAWPMPNPYKVVPVVPLCNRPRLLKAGVSELKKVIPVQDAVNKVAMDLILASEYQSFRQRIFIGMTVETDPETNEPIEPFGGKGGYDRVLVVEDKDVKAVEFSQVDLEGYIKAVEMFIQHIASQTRTPPHYFFLRGQFPSGESIKAAETGLVAKARRKMRFFGEAWEDVIRMAFAIENIQRDTVAMETIWGDPESRTEAEHVDATVKKQALGVPEEQLWEDVGYSPQQIQRFIEMRAAEPSAPAPVLVLNPVRPNGAAPSTADGGGGYG